MMRGKLPIDPDLDVVTATTLILSRADAVGPAFAAVSDWFTARHSELIELTSHFRDCQHMDVRIFGIGGRRVIRRDDLRDLLAAQRWSDPGLVAMILSTWDGRSIIYRSRLAEAPINRPHNT